MANLKISQMTDGGAPQNGDNAPIVRGGANYRVQLGTMAGAQTSDYPSFSDLDNYLTSASILGTANETDVIVNSAGDVIIGLASGINAALIGDGSVSTTEFQYINTLSSNAQTQINGKRADFSNGQLPGTSTNDSASAGNVGEYVESIILSGSAVSLTSTVVSNVTSLSLTAGDWDLDGRVWYTAGASTVTANTIAGFNTTSATLPSNISGGRVQWADSNAITGNVLPTLTPGPHRISLSATTTVYMVAYGQFTTSTLAAYGIMRARRMR